VKLDLKKLKKVSSDKHKTVLKHPKGHQIIVAHKGLSKPNLEALSKLPGMHKNPENVEENTPAYFPNFADGGDVEEVGIAKSFGGVKRKIIDWAHEGKTEKQLMAEKYAADPRLGRPEYELPEEVKGHYADGGKVKMTEKDFPYVEESEGNAPANMPGEPTPEAVKNYIDFIESHPEYEKAKFPPEVQEFHKQGKIKNLEKPVNIRFPQYEPGSVAKKEANRAPAAEEEIKPATEEEKAASHKAILEAREASRKKLGIPKKKLEEMDKIPTPAGQASETNVGPVGPQSPHAVPIAPEQGVPNTPSYPQRLPQSTAAPTPQTSVQMPTMNIPVAEAPAAAPAVSQARPGEPPGMPSDEQLAQIEKEMAAKPPEFQYAATPPSVVPKQLPKQYAKDVFAPAYETKLKAAQVAEQGAEKGFEAAQSLAERQYAASDVTLNKLNMLTADYEAALKTIQGERQNRIDDINKRMIDPYRVIRNMSEGDRISASFGLILGGIGAGLTGQPNLAYQIMKDAIDRDIDAQAKNLGVQQNLLSKDLEYFKDMYSARANLKGTYLDMLNAMTERAKAMNLPQQKQAELMTIQANILNDIAKTEQEIAQRQALIKAQQMGGAEGVRGTTAALRTLGPEGMKIAEDIESKYVPGVGQAAIAVPANIRDKMIASQDMTKKINELIEFSKKHGGTILNQSIRNEGAAMAELARQSVREAYAMGVIKDSEVELMNKLISEPTQVFASWRSQPGYRTVLKGVEDKYNTLLKGYGIKPIEQAAPEKAAPKGEKPAAKQTSKYKDGDIEYKNGEAYQYDSKKNGFVKVQKKAGK